MLQDWLKKLAPLFSSDQKTKANRDSHKLHSFSRALRQLHDYHTLSFDWFAVLSVSFVIDKSDYFGFGFTTLN